MIPSISLLAPVSLPALLTLAFQHRIYVSKVSRYDSEYRIKISQNEQAIFLKVSLFRSESHSKAKVTCPDFILCVTKPCIFQVIRAIMTWF